MDTIHDIIFGQIGSTSRLRDPNWRKVPIHVHWVLPGFVCLQVQATSPPGIHYAFPEKIDYDPLRDEIYEIIEKCLNGCHSSNREPYPPAGPVRAVLHSVVAASMHYTHSDRVELYRIGINPITYNGALGHMVLWGQKFCTIKGTMELIVDRGVVNPEFMALL